MQINYSNFLNIIAVSEKAEEIKLTSQIYRLQSYHSVFSYFPSKTMHTDAHKPKRSTSFSFLPKHSSFFPTSLAPSISSELFLSSFCLSVLLDLHVCAFFYLLADLFPIGILLTFFLIKPQSEMQAT